MAAAYEWHNYGKTTIGNRSDIERVPIENLQAFYRKHYQPDNAMVVVAGKFDEKKTLDLIQKHFGAIPKPDRKLDATYTEEPEQDGERLVTLRRVGDVALVGVAWHIPAGAAPGFSAAASAGEHFGQRTVGDGLQSTGADQKGQLTFPRSPAASTTPASFLPMPRCRRTSRSMKSRTS